MANITLFFRIEKSVAIKVVSLATLDSVDREMLAESIFNEIEMSKRLSRASKHIVRMFDFDFHQQTGLAFLIMELGEHDLETALNNHPRLSPAERKHIWQQLVRIALVLDDYNIVIQLISDFLLSLILLSAFCLAGTLGY